MPANMWTYKDIIDGVDLYGFTVAARDGRIGTVARRRTHATRATSSSSRNPVSEQTGGLIPAAAIVAIEPAERLIHVDCTHEQVRTSPYLVSERLPHHSSLSAFEGHYAA